MKFRVVTYNIRGGLGMDDRRDTDRVAAEVAALAPDVVCFQEIHCRLPWSGFIDQPRRLAKLLGMPFTFQANLRAGFGGYGIGIASKYPAASVRRHSLPSGREQRGALEAHLLLPAGLLSVVCTHWGLDPGERVEQAEAVTGILRDLTRPVVLCGDLNEEPEAEFIQSLLTSSGLRDAFADAPARTYPADKPDERIDVVLYSEELAASRTQTVESHASDHLPLVVDFDWAG